MSGRLLTVARDEWRYWQRSKLAQTVLVIALVLAIASVWVTHSAMSLTAEKRDHMQSESEHTFVDQPDRHPHRMIHFGHYLFRSPPPLAALDPGIDQLTGNAIFLEGHRQNSATFADHKQSSGLTWLGKLTPSFVMQVLTPLLLIVLGFGVMTREREAGTLDFLKVQGVSPLTLIAGKALALAAAGLLILVPLLVGAAVALVQGAALLPVIAFIFSYLVYLAFWCGVVMLVSTLTSTNSTSLSSLIAVWIVLCLIFPRIASNTASVMVASPGKLETDFAVLQKLRTMGDGHNASDPAFKALKANLLAKYNVDKIEDLPVNFKGIVAQQSEADLTQILNEFSRQQMQRERAQADIARLFGWLSPVIALQTASMKLAGTDLENYQRFLREAEAVRFDFVQSLNKLHAEGLTYAEDSNKYQSLENKRKATVSADNWKILSDFHFIPLAPEKRLASSAIALAQLLFAMTVVFGLIVFAGRRI